MSHESPSRSLRADSSLSSENLAEHSGIGNGSSSLPEVGRESEAMLPAEQLKNRGTGQYVCKHRDQCTKGGVTADGIVKVFTRNSEYRLVAAWNFMKSPY